MMTNQHSPARASQGFGDFLWGVLAALMIGCGLGFYIACATRGAEILGMPAWTYDFAVLAALAAVGLLWAARRLGDASEAFFISRMCGVAFLVAAGVFFMTGLFDGQTGANPNGLALAAMRLTLGRYMAWASLVAIPACALVANCGFVIALRTKRSRQVRGRPY